MHNQKNCCNKLFTDFKFQNIMDADPPEAKGVYVIRIKKRGKTLIEEMIRRTEKLVSKIGWKNGRGICYWTCKTAQQNRGMSSNLHRFRSAQKRKQKHFKRKV